MRLFHNLSIRRKLTFMIMVTTCTAVLTACAVFMGFDIYSFRQSKVHDLETLAEILAANSTAAMTFGEPGSAHEVLQALRVTEHVIAAGVYRADGRLFAWAQWVPTHRSYGWAFSATVLKSHRSRFA